MKGKERVPVPVAGPAFRGGVKFVMFYVFSGFLQPAAEIDPVQSALPPVSDARLEDTKEQKKQQEKEEKGEVEETEVRKKIPESKSRMTESRQIGGRKKHKKWMSNTKNNYSKARK